MLLGTAYEGVPAVIKYVSQSPIGPWEYDGVLYEYHFDATTIECPSLIHVGEHAVLMFSVFDKAINSSYTLFVIGSFQGNNFVSVDEPQRLDYGGHLYAT